MSRFIKKALEKLPRLDKAQLGELLKDIVSEHQLYEASLQSIPGGLVVLSSDNQVLFHNKTAERFLGLPLSVETSEKPIWNLPIDREVAEYLRQALTSTEPMVAREFTFDAPNGPRILNFLPLPLMEDGRIQGSMIFIQDVTERKNRESRLRRAESLASLTTLAAGVAHEIKNPLGSMGIHIQLIQRALKNPTPAALATMAKDLEVINEEISRLNGIVVDFLFAVRPMDTNLVLGSVGKVLKDLVDFMDGELEQAHVNVKLSLAPGDDTVLIDERFLKQAFLNIVKNSLHAMPDGGSLTVSTKRTVSGLEVQVSDTGSGIPPELLEKIFEPYFTTKDFGSGLGLTLVYKIVKEHDADIRVTSKVGVGTTVTLLFPWPARTPQLLDFKGELP